ncbi:MAG: PadR family transcriptional regulator [Candidatus Tyrphobacter sp.]
MARADGWREDRFWRSTGYRGHAKRFRRGALKLVMLKLLSELPRHGYDLIRAFREQGWSAGAGSVYPLLAFLESSGYVTSHQEGDRRTYQVTEKGRTLLEDRAADVASFFEAVSQSREEPGDELQDALERLGSAVEQLAGHAKDETIARARDLLDRTRKEIYTLLAQE